MAELVLYIKMRRGLSITAYQFHKLLEYEREFLAKQTPRKGPRTVEVPVGDKNFALKSSSMKFHSQKFKKKRPRHGAALHHSEIKWGFTPRTPALHRLHPRDLLASSIPLSTRAQYYNRKGVSSLRIGLRRSLLETPGSQPRAKFFESKLELSVANSTCTKSLNGSHKKIATGISHESSVHGGQGKASKLKNSLSGFHLHHNGGRKANMISAGTSKPGEGPWKKGYGLQINNVNIYNAKFRKHLQPEKFRQFSGQARASGAPKIRANGPATAKLSSGTGRKRVEAPRPLRGSLQLKSGQSKKNRKRLRQRRKRSQTDYGNDFYAKTNDEIEAEFERSRREKKEKGSSGWNKFADSFLSMFKK